MFGDIGDTMLGKVVTITGVLLREVVVVVMAWVAEVVCEDMLELSVRLAFVLVAGETVDTPALLVGEVSPGCSVLSGVRGTIPLQYSLLPKLILLWMASINTAHSWLVNLSTITEPFGLMKTLSL